MDEISGVPQVAYTSTQSVEVKVSGGDLDSLTSDLAQAPVEDSGRVNAANAPSLSELVGRFNI